jgi:tetratricopeptide (TPR) repeat protein
MSHRRILRDAARCAALAAAAWLAAAGTAPAADQNSHQHHRPKARTEVGPYAPLPAGSPAGYADARPPLLENLGTLTYPVATKSRLAQSYFDQGLRLAYAFNHAEARRAFREAQRQDPGCAICYWGEALVLGPNINAPMAPEATRPALAALARAKARAARASARERALIEALVARYSDDPKAERAALDAAYAGAMGRVAARFPDDPEIAVLHAEAMMNLSPWDYWEAGGSRPKGKTAEIVQTLERVLARNPDHPGAIHYYIHMVEASDRPQRAEPYADRLGKLMPGAGHLVHMPSHTYYRVGRYLDSLAVNKAAVAADEAYIARVEPRGLYPQAYYPHNVHMLLVSAQMAGDGRTALEAATKLAGATTDEAARTVPWVQPIKAAPYFAHARFSDPATVLALPPPAEEFPYVKASWHYARGVAQAARGDLAGAQAEADAIATLEQTGDFAALIAGGIPAKEVLGIERHVVLARIAQGRGDLGAAVEQLRTAIGLEDGLAYTEPPFWYYPLRQTLGALLLQAGRADEAEAAFRASLTRTPNNGWACFGLLQAAKARGDQKAAAEAAARLERSWSGDRSLLDLSRL